MLKSKLVIALLVITGSVAIAAEVIDNAGPSGTWRYKITVSVETPEGIKIGSAVREAHVKLEPRPGYRPYSYHSVEKTKGEAVVVDLGKRGMLFALTSVDDYQIFFGAFPTKGPTTPPGVEYYNNLKNAKATLTPQLYPRLVMFKDLSDPMSVVSVFETSGCMERDTNGTCIKEQFHITGDHFEELFGEGVGLREITIETTDEPVTWGTVDKWLPWLPEYYNKMFDGSTHNYLGAANPVANSLSAGVFSTGRKE